MIKRFNFLNSNQVNYQFEPFLNSKDSVLNNSSFKNHNLVDNFNALKNTLNIDNCMYYLYDNHIYIPKSKSNEFNIADQSQAKNISLVIEPISILASSDLNCATYFFKNVIVSKNSLLIFSNMN